MWVQVSKIDTFLLTDRPTPELGDCKPTFLKFYCNVFFLTIDSMIHGASVELTKDLCKTCFNGSDLHQQFNSGQLVFSGWEAFQDGSPLEQCPKFCAEFNNVDHDFIRAAPFMNGLCFCLTRDQRMNQSCVENLMPTCQRSSTQPCDATDINVCPTSEFDVLSYTLPPFNDKGTFLFKIFPKDGLNFELESIGKF